MFGRIEQIFPCGLLIAGLGLILVAALTDNIARAMHRPIPLVEHWPYLLLGLLGLFLLLQLFALLFAKDEPREPCVQDLEVGEDFRHHWH